ncbi:MAG: DUF2239 family protein [Bdellovibrionota bacterium]
MEPRLDRTCTAFADHKMIAKGDIRDVVVKLKEYLKKDTKISFLVFDDLTSAQIELDLRGPTKTVLKKLEDLELSPDKRSGPGRPKLGVQAKEITLLPQHWEWLAIQPGGASVTLRKLVDDAKKKNQSRDQIRQAQEATHKFMTAMAGDLTNYEEALRALYAKDSRTFLKLISAWPKDIRNHTESVSKAAFPS